MYDAPKFSEMMDMLSPKQLTWNGQSYSIGDWGQRRHGEIVRINRTKTSEIEVFSTFVSGLLHGRADTGKYRERIDLMGNCFGSLSDITEAKVREVLISNRYYGLDRGINVILEAKRLAMKTKEEYGAVSFPWELYFLKAEAEYQSGFDDDPFLDIKGVGRKVRDFALAQFSLHYCAIDRHVSRFIARTGLLLHGYGDPDLGTNPADEGNYKFMQRLVIQFSKETGWSPGSCSGWAPSAIDASVWFFGQGICGANPSCLECPIGGLCLTSMKRA
jgi:endonuclease III